VERIVAASPGPDVLDVGCGTGIAARQFQAVGGRVLGVDADARMAEWARRTGVETEVATFEAWESAGREFDAVVAGQAWHWVDPVAGAAKAAQVLRPGGMHAVLPRDDARPGQLLHVLHQGGRRYPAELVPTSGGHTHFAPGKLEELLAGIGAAIDMAGASICSP